MGKSTASTALHTTKLWALRFPPFCQNLGCPSRAFSRPGLFPRKVSCIGYSSPESAGRASFRLCCLFFPILRRRVGFERTEKATRDAGYFIDGSQKRGFVRLRRLVKPADFSYKLKRSCLNLFVGDWRIEIEKSLDIPAHLR